MWKQLTCLRASSSNHLAFSLSPGFYQTFSPRGSQVICGSLLGDSHGPLASCQCLLWPRYLLFCICICEFSVAATDLVAAPAKPPLSPRQRRPLCLRLFVSNLKHGIACVRFIIYFSSYCHKTPDKKRFKEGRAYEDLELRLLVSPGSLSS